MGQSSTNASTEDNAATSNIPMQELAPDLNDLAAIDAAYDTEKGGPKYSPRIAVDATDKNGTHKSTILRYYLTPLTVSLSKDQLKHVCDTS